MPVRQRLPLPRDFRIRAKPQARTYRQRLLHKHLQTQKLPLPSASPIRVRATQTPRPPRPRRLMRRRKRRCRMRGARGKVPAVQVALRVRRIRPLLPHVHLRPMIQTPMIRQLSHGEIGTACPPVHDRPHRSVSRKTYRSPDFISTMAITRAHTTAQKTLSALTAKMPKRSWFWRTPLGSWESWMRLTQPTVSAWIWIQCPRYARVQNVPCMR